MDWSIWAFVILSNIRNKKINLDLPHFVVIIINIELCLHSTSYTILLYPYAYIWLLLSIYDQIPIKVVIFFKTVVQLLISYYFITMCIIGKLFRIFGVII